MEENVCSLLSRVRDGTEHLRELRVVSLFAVQNRGGVECPSPCKLRLFTFIRGGPIFEVGSLIFVVLEFATSQCLVTRFLNSVYFGLF